MARVNNLNNFLIDVASAIKTKKGSETAIPAANFDTEILALPSQGTYEQRVLNISTNGTQTITPSSGYDAIDELKLTVAVPEKQLQSKTYNFTQNTTIQLLPDTGYDGFDIVTLNINVPGSTINNQDKTITQNGTYQADSGYTGLGTVTVNVPSGGEIPVKLFETEQAMQADSSAQDGDLALVYRHNQLQLTENTRFRAIHIPDEIFIEGGVSSYIRGDWYSVNGGSSAGYIDVTVSPWGNVSISTANGYYSYSFDSESNSYKLDDTTNPKDLLFTDNYVFRKRYDSVIGQIFKTASNSPFVEDMSFADISVPLEINIPKYTGDNGAELNINDEYGENIGSIYVSDSTASLYMGGNDQVDVCYEYDTANNKYVRSSANFNGTPLDDSETVITLSGTYYTGKDWNDIFTQMIIPMDMYFGGLFTYQTHKSKDILYGYKLDELKSSSSSTSLDTSECTKLSLRYDWNKIFNSFVTAFNNENPFKTYPNNQISMNLFWANNKCHIYIIIYSNATDLSSPNYVTSGTTFGGNYLNELFTWVQNNGMTYDAYDMAVDPVTYEYTITQIKSAVPLTHSVPNPVGINDDLYLIGLFRMYNGKLNYTPLTGSGTLWTFTNYTAGQTTTTSKSMYISSQSYQDVTEYWYTTTQLTNLVANQLLPNVSAYGNEGIVTGDGSVYDNLDSSILNSKVLNITSNSKSQYTKYVTFFPPVGSSSGDFRKVYGNRLSYWKTDVNYGEATYGDTTDLDYIGNTSTYSRIYNAAKTMYIPVLYNGNTIVIYNADNTVAFTLSDLQNYMDYNSEIPYIIGDYAYYSAYDKTNKIYGLVKISMLDGTYSFVLTEPYNSAWYNYGSITKCVLLLNRYLVYYCERRCSNNSTNKYPRYVYMGVYDTVNNRSIVINNQVLQSDYNFSNYSSFSHIGFTNSKLWFFVEPLIPTSSSGATAGLIHCSLDLTNWTTSYLKNSPISATGGNYSFTRGIFGNDLVYNNIPYRQTSAGKVTKDGTEYQFQFEQMDKLGDSHSPTVTLKQLYVYVDWTDTFPETSDVHLLRIPSEENKFLLVSDPNDYNGLVSKCRIDYVSDTVAKIVPFGKSVRVNTNFSYTKYKTSTGTTVNFPTNFAKFKGGTSSSGEYLSLRGDYDATNADSLVEYFSMSMYYGWLKLKPIQECDLQDMDFAYIFNSDLWMPIHTDDLTKIVEE